MTSPDPFVTEREHDPDDLLVWDDFDGDDDRREDDREADSMLTHYGFE